MSFEPLISKIREKNNPTVMGLAPILDYVPDYIKEKAVKEYGDTFKAAGSHSRSQASVRILRNVRHRGTYRT